MIVSLLGLSVLCGQPVEEPPSFYLSVVSLGLEDMPDLYWRSMEVIDRRQQEPRYHRMDVGFNAMGPKVEMPLLGATSLYIQSPRTEETPETYKAIVRLPDLKDGDSYLLAFYIGEDGRSKYKFINNSADAQPSRTVRFANFTTNRVAVSLGGQAVVVGDDEVSLIGEPVFMDRDRFSFTFAVEEVGQGYLKSPTKYLRFRSADMRLLVLYAEQFILESSEGTTRRVGTKPIALRLYDRPVRASD